MTLPLLVVDRLVKRFHRHHALADVSITVEQGEFVALLGPSGCGKTTLLRCIAGFLEPDSGVITIDGADVTSLPPYRRPLNTVFQNYALFPHMTVLANVTYGPRRTGTPRMEAAARAHEALELVGLIGLAGRRPAQLSGGQQQRVALARAIVNRPKLLLLDEPLSALDLKLRQQVQIELKRLQERLGIAFLLVTHDQEEAMTMANRVVVMNAGRVEQIGTGRAIYRRPATRFVAEFIGRANIIPCRPEPPSRLRPAIGSAMIEYDAVTPDQTYCAVLRPEHIILGPAPGPDWSTADGTVEDVIDVGSQVVVSIRVGHLLITSTRPGIEPPRRGVPVDIAFRPADLHVVAE